MCIYSGTGLCIRCIHMPSFTRSHVCAFNSSLATTPVKYTNVCQETHRTQLLLCAASRKYHLQPAAMNLGKLLWSSSNGDQLDNMGSCRKESTAFRVLAITIRRKRNNAFLSRSSLLFCANGAQHIQRKWQQHAPAVPWPPDSILDRYKCCRAHSNTNRFTVALAHIHPCTQAHTHTYRTLTPVLHTKFRVRMRVLCARSLISRIAHVCAWRSPAHQLLLLLGWDVCGWMDTALQDRE